jgi:hypothetical protein
MFTRFSQLQIVAKYFAIGIYDETSFTIQKRLQWEGITTVILPIRVNI